MIEEGHKCRGHEISGRDDFASQITATFPEEMEDLSKIPGGLSIKFWTPTSLERMIVAGTDSSPLPASQNPQSIKDKAQTQIESLFSIRCVGATSFCKRATAGTL